MFHLHRIYAKFTPDKVSLLKSFNIDVNEGFTSFDIYDNNSEYKKITALIENEKDFSNRVVGVNFTKQEYDEAEKYMLRSGFILKEDKTSLDTRIREELYGGICKNCMLPSSIVQVKPAVFKKEYTLRAKEFCFTTNSHWPLLFTTKDKYEKYFSKWFEFREVLIDKNRQVSSNLIQLDIPIASSKLIFGNSSFGLTFDVNNGTGKSGAFQPCNICGKIKHTNQVIDFFPDFERDFNFNIIYTKEWFGIRHHIVISKEFARHLVELEMIKWDSYALIPVKKFQSYIK